METPRRRITVTSSLNETPPDRLGYRELMRVGGGGDVITPDLTSFYFLFFFVYFFGGLECVGHSFAYVAHV